MTGTGSAARTAKATSGRSSNTVVQVGLRSDNLTGRTIRDRRDDESGRIEQRGQSEALHQTGHAKQSVSCFAGRARVSRLVSLLFGGAVTSSSSLRLQVHAAGAKGSPAPARPPLGPSHT
jgi:hypothetical protein